MSQPLTPSEAPPLTPSTTGLLQKPRSTLNLSDISNMPQTATRSLPPLHAAVLKESALKEPASIGGDVLARIKCPTVILDTPHITSTMAATLGMSLLGHVLFLKSQVPFPVVQLARMPCGQSDSRAAKRKAELLSAYDTLSSHLQTTFSALSTAYARRKTTKANKADATCDAHLLFVLGPSVGAPKARVMFVLDGLEVKVWEGHDCAALGANGDENRNKATVKEVPEDHDASGEENIDSSEEDESDYEDGDCEEEDDDSNDDSDYLSADDSDAPEPPPSRSPSPAPPSSDLPPSTPTPISRSAPQARPSLAQIPHTPVTAPHTPTSRGSMANYAEEQQALRAAERLLSRTLANACADEGGGMSSELAPTQTHILLRAPRRFSHPAWLPRQNLVRAMDATLNGFLEDTIFVEGIAAKPRAKAGRGVKTEGVWLGCRASTGSKGLQTKEHDAGEDEDDEDDEMIWWVWDGKLHGFADW